MKILILFLFLPAIVYCQESTETIFKENCNICHISKGSIRNQTFGFSDFKNIYFGVTKDDFDKRINWLIFSKEKEENEVHNYYKRILGEKQIKEVLDLVYKANSKEKYELKSKVDFDLVIKDNCSMCHIPDSQKLNLDLQLKKFKVKNKIDDKQQISPQNYFDMLNVCNKSSNGFEGLIAKSSNDDLDNQVKIYMYINSKNNFDLKLNEGKFPLLIIENPLLSSSHKDNKEESQPSVKDKSSAESNQKEIKEEGQPVKKNEK